MKFVVVPAMAVAFFSCLCLAADETGSESPPENSEEPSIRLESTFTGDKEQPAVSYFIPWQGTSTPDKLQWEIQQKHDATLQLIDRDVMLRSINIYNDMDLEKPDAMTPAAD